MSEPAPSPPGLPSILEALMEVLQSVVKRLQKPLYLFIIAFSIIVIIFVLSFTGLGPDAQTPLYVSLSVLGVLALTAIIAGFVLEYLKVYSPANSIEKEDDENMASTDSAEESHSGEVLEHEQLIRLRRIIAARFNRGELRDLCFDLGVDYDDLPGTGKASKARELVDYLSRRRRTHELVEVGRELRPDVDWGQVFEGNGANQSTPDSESSSESFDEILTFVQQRMTSSEFDEMVVRLLDQGQRAGLSKPITPAGFLDAMRTWGRLAKVVRYLRQRFPERFSG